MKALLYSARYELEEQSDADRYIKVIKGSLEMVDVESSNIPLGKFDLIHLTSPISESKINEINEQNIPVILSAFYSENDPTLSFFEHNSRDNESKLMINNKNIGIFNKADLILVPNEETVNLLKEYGIERPIKAMIPGTNLAIFDFFRQDEKDIFYRYFKEDSKRKIVISTGVVNNGIADGFGPVIAAAKKSPNASFYYLGFTRGKKAITLALKRKINNAPKNVHFCTNIPSDILRSAMYNASIYLNACYNAPSIIYLLSAMAAKCQIVSRKNLMLEGYIENEVNGYLAEYTETLGILVRELLNEEIKPTIDNAYEFVKKYSMERFGSELKEIYKTVINNRKEDKLL